MMTHWVIYYGASNHPPGKWVVRAWDIYGKPARLVARTECTEHESLGAARAAIPQGLYLVPRQEADDPAIAEVWI